MSNALAIAAVTKVIKEYLHNELNSTDLSSKIGGDVIVSTTTIDSLKTGGEKEQLNIFLYHMAPNQGMQNEELPSRDRNSFVVKKPYLALDLYYLLSAHGGDQVKAQMLLGYAIRALHDWPVLSSEQITAILKDDDMLKGSGIENQVDSIRISPHQLNLEELSKLWAALQSNLRTSATYRVSAAIITSELEKRAVLPVISRDISVLMIRQPYLKNVAQLVPQDEPHSETYLPESILPGQTVVIRGNELDGDSIHFLLDGGTFTGTVGDIDNGSVIITLPADLECGVHTLQCDVGVLIGNAPSRYVTFRSNLLPFVVSPRIVLVKRSDDGLRIEVKVQNAFRAGQVAILFLYLIESGKAKSEADPTFVLEDPQGSTYTVPVEPKNGEYLVRIAVDGAMSPIVIDSDSGQYDASTRVML